MQLMSKLDDNHILEDRVHDLMQEDLCFVMRARRLSRLVTRLYDEALRDHEVTGPQFTLLFSLVVFGPQQAVTLAQELDIEKSTLSRTIKRMLDSGWLEERQGEGKAKTLVLTKKGRQVLMRVLPSWEKAQKRAREMFGSEGSGALDNLIECARGL